MARTQLVHSSRPRFRSNMALNLPSLRALVARPHLSSPLSSSSFPLLSSTPSRILPISRSSLLPSVLLRRPAATLRGPVTISAGPKNTPEGERKSGRRIWRRRKLTKRDKKEAIGRYCMERVPFLEEQMLKMKETGAVISADIDLLLLSEENKYAFAVDVAAEAGAHVQADPDEYGSKKAILHVLSDRMNDIGIYRPEAYIETDPFKPGPGYRRERIK